MGRLLLDPPIGFRDELVAFALGGAANASPSNNRTCSTVQGSGEALRKWAVASANSADVC